MANQDCDQFKLIPEGCLECGDKAIKYCSSDGAVIFKYCEKCVSDFTEAGGCDCLKMEDRDLSNIISQGCYKCEGRAIKLCSSE